MRAVCQGLLFASACTLLGGCPAEECEGPRVQVKLTAEREPHIGTFSGTFTWLQTGEETTLDISVVPQKDVATTFCGSGRATVDVSATTQDGVLSERVSSDEDVSSRGTFQGGLSAVRLDLEILVAAGKIPDAPDILSRNPTADLSFWVSEEGTMEALILVWGGADRLHVGMGTLTRRQAP